MGVELKLNAVLPPAEFNWPLIVFTLEAKVGSGL
jgi:hypothetical protein